MNSGAKNFSKQRLNELFKLLSEESKTYLGFPNNQHLDNEDLAPFFNLVINNIGDPFVGNLGINTCEFEVEVVKFFFNLFKLEPQNAWGYISNGGTESNIHAFFLAREAFPTGRLFFSNNSHYSLPKTAKLLRIEPVVVNSQENGEIDYEHFGYQVDQYSDSPILFNANIGTTLKGGIDRVERIIEILAKKRVKDFFIHCDAALFGGFLPFLKGGPVFDFQLPVSSIAISGHKFFGSPIPCGIQIVKKEYVERVKRKVDYIDSFDGTISGSRDGITVLILWKTIVERGIEGFTEWAESCMKNTEYAVEQLKSKDQHAYANPFSNIVVLKRPSQKIIQRWKLASQNEISHLVIMPSVTREKIDLFVSEYSPEVLR
ncbi:MAG: histidine decarboxylase [Candidatus Riflebacteria bacterium]|nr:histidine decarboxylase [Candidatus Riflebacteria bacterium]